jgi:hypothetical protein
MLVPDSDFFPSESWDPDPGSRDQEAPYPGSGSIIPIPRVNFLLVMTKSDQDPDPHCPIYSKEFGERVRRPKFC